jgi:hypothetical protein
LVSPSARGVRCDNKMNEIQHTKGNDNVGGSEKGVMSKCLYNPEA